jgi:hypothetical protein
MGDDEEGCGPGLEVLFKPDNGGEALQFVLIRVVNGVSSIISLTQGSL